MGKMFVTKHREDILLIIVTNILNVDNFILLVNAFLFLEKRFVICSLVMNILFNRRVYFLVLFNKFVQEPYNSDVTSESTHAYKHVI